MSPENSEKSDWDASPLEEKISEIYKPPKPEPHLKPTRRQLVSEVEDLNLNRDREHLEKVVEQKTTDLTDAVAHQQKRDATIEGLGEGVRADGDGGRAQQESVGNSSRNVFESAEVARLRMGCPLKRPRSKTR